MSLNSNDVNANFFRTYPSDEHLVTIIRAVVRYYGWKKVHLITQDEALFTDVSKCMIHLDAHQPGLAIVGVAALCERSLQCCVH